MADGLMSVGSNDFYKLKEELVRNGQVFEVEHLANLSYSDLVLCAIGNAGAAACSIDLVKKTQYARLHPYLFMSQEDLQEHKQVLQDHGMWEDLLVLRQKHSDAPSWKELSTIQKLYFKLKCLRNHWDNPVPRIEDALKLNRELNASVVDLDNARPLKMLLAGIHLSLQNSAKALHLRSRLQIVSELPQYMTESEQSVCKTHHIRDYVCSGGCFRPEV